VIVSVTRLRVRSLRYLPAFLWNTFFADRQVARSDGFLGGRLLVDRRHTYWTLTLWKSEQAMKAFRGSGAHAKVMPKLAEWCDEAAYMHWSTESVVVPSWKEAYERLVSEGRLSRVNHPSPDHEARKFAEPRLSPPIGKEMRPARRE
jgi:hypothetical protein